MPTETGYKRAVADPLEPCDLLIAAAFAPELEGLAALLGPQMRGQVAGLRIAARSVGVGLVAAATGTASRLATTRPRAVVLVGTCGSYPGTELAIGDVVSARSVLLVAPAVVDGEAAFPEPMSARVDAHAPLTAAISTAGAQAVVMGTTLAITTSDALSERLAAETGAAVEHLEAFAVATACGLDRVPFTALLGVANAVGSLGREQWRANHAAAATAAATYVARWVQAGAAGVPHQ